MELYQLEHFIAVVEEHSFTRAAERVFRTQAAVSVSIKKLEEEIGARLVARNSHDCTLTEAGELMLDYARRMLDLRGEMQRTLAEFVQLGTGHVSIAAHESAAQYLLPDPMAAFHKQFPDIKIQTRLCGVDEIAQLVAARASDLGFGVTQANLRGLRSEVVHADPLVLVVGPGHPLAARAATRLADLGEERFFVHHLHTATSDAIQRLFEERGVVFNVVAELWNFETVKRFVKAGSGVAIIPLSVARADLEEGSVTAVPVIDMDITRRIELVSRDRSELLPAPRELLRILRSWNWTDGERLLPGRTRSTIATVHPIDRAG